MSARAPARCSSSTTPGGSTPPCAACATSSRPGPSARSCRRRATTPTACSTPARTSSIYCASSSATSAGFSAPPTTGARSPRATSPSTRSSSSRPARARRSSASTCATIGSSTSTSTGAPARPRSRDPVTGARGPGPRPGGAGEGGPGAASPRSRPCTRCARARRAAARGCSCSTPEVLMPTSELALLGGPKTRTAPFPPYPVIGAEERRAVMEVLDEGRLSTFIASPGEHFLGGKRIRAFERAFADYHGVRFAVAFNSATSALHAAVVALDVPAGHEVLVPPYTFTSTATCALMAGAVPVFVDVEPETFCLDPKALEATLSPLSRVVIPVHLFGHPAPMDEIMDVARRHSLRVIEDAAQAPGAVYRGRPVGTLGDCAVYSFQESKNLMTGEGGMLITDDPQVAEVAQLVRNHGEMIEEASTRRTYRSEILGYGYRMTEFEAALGLVQLGRLPAQNAARQRLAGHLTRALAGVPGPPAPRGPPRRGPGL